MERTILDSAQREVLDVMSCLQTEDDLHELKTVLVRFLNERLQKELDTLWEDGTIDEEKMRQWRTTHFRTPYKQKQ